MTRKDYQLVAAAIASTNADGDADTDTLVAVVEKLADEFEYDNPNFSRTKFYKACGVGYE